MKKKSKSILAIVLAILLVIVVAISLTTNILFSRKDTPKIFGHYIYLMEYDTMEAAAGAAVATGTSGQAGLWAACCSAFSARATAICSSSRACSQAASRSAFSRRRAIIWRSQANSRVW